MTNIVDTTENCRYCLMCRHICPVTRVTFNEATSPHGWALAVASVRRGLLEWDAATANLLYQCADCGACQAFCVTDQPLPYAIVAARAEVAASGRAPAVVAEIDAALRAWGNPYAPPVEPPPPSERADVALFAGDAAWHREPASLDAARTLLGQAGIAHGLAAPGLSSGYLAYTVGLHETARGLARQVAEQIEQAGARTLVVLSAEDAHTLRAIYPLLGVPLGAGVEVIELAEVLARLLAEERLRVKPLDAGVAYHDPCHTPRLPGRWHAARQILAALTPDVRAGFWREARAASCGAAGGLPWTQPALAGGMARAALDDAAGSGARLVVADAPGCLAHLRAHAGAGVEVRGLYELLAAQVQS